MKRKEFIKIMKSVIKRVESMNYAYTCNLLKSESLALKEDYVKVYSDYLVIDVGFVREGEKIKEADYNMIVKERRLNALTMYMAQSLAFKTYKDL